VPIPINLNTINKLYGLNLNSSQVEEFFASKAETITRVKTSEDVVVSKVGRELYEKFFRGYTRKMWELDPSELDASVTAGYQRAPTATIVILPIPSRQCHCMVILPCSRKCFRIRT
jgi:UDP-galactopyranose mutase